MRRKSSGFTLAELLIALAILGVIATFTIPKVLQSSSSGQNTAIAKEAASMVSGAQQSLGLDGLLSASATPASLTTYMNYVSIVTAGTLSAATPASAGTALQTCSAALPCMKLHNGGVLQYDTAMNYGGATTNAVYFNIDPDGTGAAGRVSLCSLYNGRLTTPNQDTNACAAANISGTETLALQTTDPSYLTNWN